MFKYLYELGSFLGVIMKKLLILILLIILSFATACKLRIETYEYGDFKYHIIQINDEGKRITPDTDNKNVVDEYIRIIGLSEEGMVKEILIVPHYINGIEVREVGSPPFHGTGGTWKSENLRKIYIPFPAEVYVYPGDATNLERVIVLEHEPIVPGSFCITSYYRGEENLDGIKPGGTRYANVSYMYNYDDSLNRGYYWIDDYDYGTKITYIPENPTRTGYIFGGWYKEEACTNKWDFDNDKLPDALYDNEKRVLYQETILYAKWIEKE